jgi:hypothetical protein
MADQPPPVAIESLKSIFIDLHAGVIELAGDDGTLIKLAVSRVPIETADVVPAEVSSETVTKGEPAQEADGDGTGKQKTVTLTGRLKSKPREGRPDGRGQATSWSKLACHEDGRDSAKMYSATFHRHTAAIALRLATDDLVTVQGYVRESPDPNRMDSLSVFNILAYPGKP